MSSDDEYEYVQGPLRPYGMCSREEVADRFEVSIFEATDDSWQSPAGQRRMDPHRAIVKYTRSTANVSSCSSKDEHGRYPVRSISQLVDTVHYLLGTVLATQLPGNSALNRPPASFLSTVHFVEDRLRAVQVDCTRWQNNCTKQEAEQLRRLQFCMTRGHIFISSQTTAYSEAQYSSTLGRTARDQALAAYWAHVTESDCQSMDDAILCWTLLCHLSSCLTQHEAFAADTPISQADTPLLPYSIVALLRKRESSKLSALLRFRWALALTVDVSLGHWTVALRQLRDGPTIAAQTGAFGVLARSCFRPNNIVYMQWKALQVYNFSWMKNETVSTAELARLLSMSQPEVRPSSVSLPGSSLECNNHVEDTRHERCNDSVLQRVTELVSRHGLPLVDDGTAVAFKSAPLQPVVNMPDAGAWWHHGRVDQDGIGIPSAAAIRSVIFNHI
jgi:SAC3/GANP family